MQLVKSEPGQDGAPKTTNAFWKSCLGRLILYILYSEVGRSSMAVVPIRLTEEQVRKINLLIKLGIYSNRSEAIKSMLERSMDSEVQGYLTNAKVQKAVRTLLVHKGIQDPLVLTPKKTAVELIAEGRQ